MRSVILFSLLRLLAFAAPLALLLMLNVPPMWAAIAAAVLGFALSLVFLRTPRERVATSLYEARHPVHGEDEDVEDDYLDDEDDLLDHEEADLPTAGEAEVTSSAPTGTEK
ncbi:DUF4229 domain-containing protein [Mycetocola tolaasinivorans]|uniref:DUF4229 domain-containing protein n=1 Tax=Mycetocola tolaasinivorans TaxID=76635 RepID=A0A3L7A5S0_9MICO|nr:DUF4229 domain-containing protein [Mycetocola tolaasinivorans]RLP75683.1 DUF4229 domain-containing protein [Mycetocola tolaasinivorans]